MAKNTAAAAVAAKPAVKPDTNDQTASPINLVSPPVEPGADNTGTVDTASEATDTNTATAAATKKKRGPRGPILVWTPSRKLAIAESYAQGAHSTKDIATLLRSHPAFEGVPAEAITQGKVMQAVRNMRREAEKRGKTLALPKLDRDYSGGGPRKGTDFDAINAALSGSQETASE